MAHLQQDINTAWADPNAEVLQNQVHSRDHSLLVNYDKTNNWATWSKTLIHTIKEQLIFEFKIISVLILYNFLLIVQLINN